MVTVAGTAHTVSAMAPGRLLPSRGPLSVLILRDRALRVNRQSFEGY